MSLAGKNSIGVTVWTSISSRCATSPKSFPGIIANDDVTLQLKKGEIHALLGENGAGKSTLMSVLFGMYQPEKGVYPEERDRRSRSRTQTTRTALGIGMVHQHFKLVHNFTVLENIILGVETIEPGLFENGRGPGKGNGPLGAVRPAGGPGRPVSPILRWACSSVWRS